MAWIHDFLILLSRLSLSAIYLWAGTAKLLNWSGTASYMRSKNFPLIPLMLPGAILIQIAGGLSVCLGFYFHLGVLALIVFTIPAMTTMHSFWKEESAASRLNEKTLFMKDLAILGGLLALLLLGPGRITVDFLK